MKMSRRAKRMQRHHKRGGRGASINLVSLMDIFTILVFFLLVNSSDVQNLPSTKDIQLPKSVAEQMPKETIFILISKTDLLVQGRPVAQVQDILNNSDNMIPALKKELEYQASRSKVSAEKEARREITIMGDKSIPYRLLKKIMITCNSVNYNNISLAVSKKGGPQG
ncbi:MAG TPA: biopolymer transporter ExbD [Candidatus Tenderia electrophaga]|uniref:Biopolymer transporter ExbD n=1 Tax=Candidatus Tenderia electrophaga TaxID=1748243 RepID=A0A832J7L7_9GAMM|nr:biopolymer transporter ExbD [Candidatus Tenderia electrophaga]